MSKDKDYYDKCLFHIERSFCQAKKALLDEMIANRKYPNGMAFPFYGEIAVITGVEVFALTHGFVTRYFCYVPSWCDSPIFGDDEPMGNNLDTGLLIAEQIIDRALKKNDAIA